MTLSLGGQPTARQCASARAVRPVAFDLYQGYSASRTILASLPLARVRSADVSLGLVRRMHALPPEETMEPITIYLAGEIHSSWRDELRGHLSDRNLPVRFVGPQEQHERSDGVGEDILGAQPSARYRDLVGAGVNTLRTRILLRRADLVVAYFGDKYRQWNTAIDAGAAVASGVPVLLVRAPELTHALKELDALAAFTVETLEQAAEAIAYVFE